MKKLIGTMIFLSLIIGIATPLVAGQLQPIKPSVDPTYVEVYTTPRHPIGADWDSGLGGDVITIYAEVTDVLNNEVWIAYEFCNRLQCIPLTWDKMTHLGGDSYSFVLPGDTFNGWPYYEASSDPLSCIIYQLYADSTDGGWAYYPSDITAPYEEFIEIHPEKTKSSLTLIWVLLAKHFSKANYSDM